MVLDPIPQSLPVHFVGSRPQPPTSPYMTWLIGLIFTVRASKCDMTHCSKCDYILVWHDSFMTICAALLIRDSLWDMTHLHGTCFKMYMTHRSKCDMTCGWKKTWLIVRRDWFVIRCETWLIRDSLGDMTHWETWLLGDSLWDMTHIYESWFKLWHKSWSKVWNDIHVWQMSHLYVWNDILFKKRHDSLCGTTHSCYCETWLIVWHNSFVTPCVAWLIMWHDSFMSLWDMTHLYGSCFKILSNANCASVKSRIL